jgi:hypothetical protein
MLAAAQQAVDSIASSQIALYAPTTSLQRDEERIAQNLPWHQVGDLASSASHPEFTWARAGINFVDALPVTGGLFLPNVHRNRQQIVDTLPLFLPVMSGQATLPSNDILRLQSLRCLQDQRRHQQNQQQLRGLTARVNTVGSTLWSNALFQDASQQLSASTWQDPLAAAVPRMLAAPATFKEGSSAKAVSMRLPCTLSNPFDVRVLSSHQTYLRQQIEVFAATTTDVAAHVRGRNKRILLDQVGIRCRHCGHMPMQKRQIGSTYFPATLMGFYQAAQNMLSTHIQCGKCESLPESVSQEFHRLLVLKKATSTGGRKYWAERIRELGLVDTDHGVFAADNVPPQARILPLDCVSATSGASGAKSKRSGALHLKAPPPNCV